MKKVLLIAVLSFISLPVLSVQVTDDEGQVHEFKTHAKRIVSLAPHITELLFAAGATDQVIATVSYSDYPEAAKKIPRIGSYKKIDLESIVALKPDLVIGWKGGGSHEQIEKIVQLGYRFYFSEPARFIDVAENIRNLGKIMGTEKVANVEATRFLYELAALEKQYSHKQPVNVFYEVWNQPLMTINKEHIISQVIKFCGGVNVFGELSARAPRVSIEAVLQKQPEAIVIGMSDNRKGWVEEWQQWQGLKAVQNGHVYAVNADYIVRQVPRILLGTRSVCESLEEVRNKKRD